MAGIRIKQVPTSSTKNLKALRWVWFPSLTSIMAGIVNMQIQDASNLALTHKSLAGF
jgi:hypothetical protein